jgi:ESAT-6 family protein
MSDMYSYDSAVARDAEGGLAATAASLQAQLADLGGFVNAACANWEGDEQALYRGIQTRWDNAAAQVRDILNQITAALGQTTESVDTMRSRVRQTLQAG